MIFELVQIPRSTITTAGQRKQVYNADIVAFGAIIQGLPANTGTVYLGDNRVSSAQYIVAMLGSDTFNLEIGKFFRNAEILISDLWYDVSVNGEGITGGIIVAKDITKVHQWADAQQEQLKLLKEIADLLKLGGSVEALIKS